MLARKQVTPLPWQPTQTLVGEPFPDHTGDTVHAVHVPSRSCSVLGCCLGMPSSPVPDQQTENP